MKVESFKTSVVQRSAHPTPLSIADVRNMLSTLAKAPESRDLRDILTMIATTGIRRGELCNLRWADVDLGQHRISVYSVKTGRKRKIPFGPKLKELLQARLDRDPNVEFVLGARPASILRAASLKLAKLSELNHKDRPVSMHRLRHSFLKWLVNTAVGSFSSFGRLAGFSPRQKWFRMFHTGVDVTAAEYSLQSRIERELLGD